MNKAGCILLSKDKKSIGLVFRSNLSDYTFPKGHVEAGESLKECAVRETEEETLRKNHIISKKYFINRYVNNKEGKINVYLYIAEDDGETDRNIKPEDRENLVWVKVDEVENKLSYPDLKVLWNRIFKYLTKNKIC